MLLNLNDKKVEFGKTNEWAETLVEAYFLDATVFVSKESQSSDDDYMLDLLDRIQKLLSKEQSEIESITNLAG